MRACDSSLLRRRELCAGAAAVMDRRNRFRRSAALSCCAPACSAACQSKGLMH